MQVDEVRIAGVQRIGVGAVGRQRQGAVLTLDGLRNNRAAGDAVGALDVVVEDVAGEGQLRFRGRGVVGVIYCLRHIVDDVDVDGGLAGAAIGIGRDHLDLLDQSGAVAACMAFVVHQRERTDDYASARVVAVDGHRIAQRRGAGQRQAADDTATDQGQATDDQRL
ncbi:hypothetical protein D3C77_529220 [compost metagenome]